MITNIDRNIPNITIAHDYGGDWSGFYVNGKLVNEGHSIRYDELLDKLQSMGLLIYKSIEVEIDCNMPEDLSDIKVFSE